jgi:hypothetical protein
VGVELNSLKSGREMKLQQVQRQDNDAHAAFAWINDLNRGGRKLKKKVRGSGFEFTRLSQVHPLACKFARPLQICLFVASGKFASKPGTALRRLL